MDAVVVERMRVDFLGPLVKVTAARGNGAEALTRRHAQASSKPTKEAAVRNRGP